MEQSGHLFKELAICGGLTKSKLYLQTHANVFKLPVIVPECSEPVLLGAAISSALALAPVSGTMKVISQMAGKGYVLHPDSESSR